MKVAERDRKIQETHQALLGIPGTADKGLVGEVKEINKHLDDHSYRIKQAEDEIEKERLLAEERRRTNKKTLGGYIAGIVAIAVALWKAFTGTP